MSQPDSPIVDGYSQTIQVVPELLEHSWRLAMQQMQMI
jgi:hypothetical protein